MRWTVLLQALSAKVAFKHKCVIRMIFFTPGGGVVMWWRQVGKCAAQLQKMLKSCAFRQNVNKNHLH